MRIRDAVWQGGVHGGVTILICGTGIWDAKPEAAARLASDKDGLKYSQRKLEGISLQLRNLILVERLNHLQFFFLLRTAEGPLQENRRSVYKSASCQVGKGRVWGGGKWHVSEGDREQEEQRDLVPPSSPDPPLPPGKGLGGSKGKRQVQVGKKKVRSMVEPSKYPSSQINKQNK